MSTTKPPRPREYEIARGWLGMASEVMTLLDSDRVGTREKERLAEMLGSVAGRLQAASRDLHTQAIVEGIIYGEDATARKAIARPGRLRRGLGHRPRNGTSNRRCRTRDGWVGDEILEHGDAIVLTISTAFPEQRDDIVETLRDVLSDIEWAIDSWTVPF